MTLLIILSLVLVLSHGLSHVLSRPNRWWYVLDRPNARSLHQQVTPRTGGVAVLAGIVMGTLGLCIQYPGENFYWLLAGIPVVLVCLWDDHQGVGVLTRLLMQCLSAVLLLLLMKPWEWLSIGLPDIVILPLIGFAVVWMINLYNFMDGMDGFAGGMALIGFVTLAMLGNAAGSGSFAAFSLVLAMASAGFLFLNFPPARLFLGDVGSSSLGFMVAGLMLWGERDDVVPISLSMLVFFPFISDATVTLLRRLGCGERIWQAHREHYYQRLVCLGWGHRRTVLAEYGLMLACGLSAFAVRSYPSILQWLMLAVWVGVYACLAWWVKRLEGSRPS